MKEFITKDQFKKVFKYAKNVDLLYDELDRLLKAYNINTKDRVVMFLAQCGHESGGFSINIENLNYSAQGLMAVFPKYFKTLEIANSYARQPEKIANLVYASRMGNGDVSSGDGWRYRGRGFIQLTGKANYQAFSKDMNIDIVINPNKVSEQMDLSILTAIWFWNKNNLNYFADKKDIEGATKKINGGLNGLSDRKVIYQSLLLFYL